MSVPVWLPAAASSAAVFIQEFIRGSREGSGRVGKQVTRESIVRDVGKAVAIVREAIPVPDSLGDTDVDHAGMLARVQAERLACLPAVLEDMLGYGIELSVGPHPAFSGPGIG